MIMVFFSGQGMEQADLDKMVEHGIAGATKMATILGDQPFFGGAKPTLGDFWYAAGIWSLCRNECGGPQAHVYEQMNKALPAPIAAWADRMAEEMKDYLAARPKCMI